MPSDKQTGISVRFIQSWNPADDRGMEDVRMVPLLVRPRWRRLRFVGEMWTCYRRRLGWYQSARQVWFALTWLPPFPKSVNRPYDH